MSTAPQSTLVRAGILGMLWSNAAFYGGKLMVFISTVLLARLLIEEDFGVAGYALIAISLLEVLNNLGVGQALIYEREDAEAASTGFWLALGFGLLLFGLCWVLAPLVGAFFNDERAVPVTRALGLTLPITALGVVHEALLSKRLAFRRKFLPDFAQAISKGVISVALALMGFGAWSLVLGQIGGKLVGVIGYWWVLPWRPQLRFARTQARGLLSYGLSIVALNLLAITLLNIDYLLIGRYLGAAALGVYTLAFRLPDLLIVQLCFVISTAIFPVYARMRDEPGALARGFVATTRYVALVTVPLGLGLALVSRPFVLTIFGERWAEASGVMAAISLYALCAALAYQAGDVYKAQGRTTLLTGLVLVRGAILVPTLWWAATGPATITAVAWSYAGATLLSNAFLLVITSRTLAVPLRVLGDAIAPALLAGSVMSVSVVGILWLTAGAPPAAQLAASVVTGAVVYTGALWLLWREVVVQARDQLQLALARGGVTV
jgi:O-antigen/teichoic acid export membrane protein